MTWHTRGSKPQRNLEAALIGGIEGLFEALQQGKRNPLLHATTRGVAAALAMKHHRVEDRCTANERNARFSSGVAEVFEVVLEARALQQGTVVKALPRIKK